MPQVVFDAMDKSGRNGIVCLTGVSTKGRTLTLDGGSVNRDLVLQNDVVFGSVNANKRHYDHAVSALTRADRGWLGALITRRVPLADFTSALLREPGDIKVVLDLTQG